MNCTIEVVIKFMGEYIITRFGMPFDLVSSNGHTLSSIQFVEWAYDNKAIIKYSSNYYAQDTGVVESTNKN